MAMIVPRTPPKPRSGCLAGCLARLLALFVFGTLIVLAVTVIVAPWGFYLGGQFHPLAYWQGWGTMHGPGGDYAVFMRMFPRTRSSGRSILSGPSVQGSGIICAPHGERYSLTLRGTFLRRGIGTNTDGEAMSLSLSQPLNFLNTNTSTRLDVGFRGAWKNPDLVLNDAGSMARTFNPDGTWTPSDRSKRPAGEPIPLTLHPGSGSDFDAACAAVKK